MVAQATSSATARNTSAAAEAFLQGRWRLLADLARVDAVLDAWGEWQHNPDRRAGVTREALEELRALLAADLAQSACVERQ
jgi:alkanesulfonate monooxygenase SsuD/methylene tetrahydromethanopterin reductase-like flavin-dependent oxidoreductase (luciferase family)